MSYCVIIFFVFRNAKKDEYFSLKKSNAKKAIILISNIVSDRKYVFQRTNFIKKSYESEFHTFHFFSQGKKKIDYILFGICPIPGNETPKAILPLLLSSS